MLRYAISCDLLLPVVLYYLNVELLFCKPNNSSALIQVVAAGANPVQITRGIEKTAKALVEELRKLSKEVKLVIRLLCCEYFLVWQSGRYESIFFRLKIVSLQMSLRSVLATTMKLVT